MRMPFSLILDLASARRRARFSWALGAGALALGIVESGANGIYREGRGARAMGLGGAIAAAPDDPISATTANPAGLTLFKTRRVTLGGVAGVADTEFSNRVNTGAGPDDAFGGLPEAALVLPFSGPFTLGIGVVPDAIMGASATYQDAPGGLGGATSYGAQTYRSEILALRTALAGGVQLGDHFSLGASAGLVYNRNRLVVPYVFQSFAPLRGAKTLFDLQTDGYGFNGTFGALFQPNEQWSFGATYQTATHIDSEGDAAGNADLQLLNLGAGPAGDFAYDAEVANRFPQTVAAGAAWRPSSAWRFSAQVDWIDWSGAFDQLEVKLSHGANSNLPRSLEDNIPLQWEDQFVYRGGVEFWINDSWTVRSGYSYGASPVPSATLSPLTGAITEHTVALGASWQWRGLTFDLAYQWALPNSQRVETSALFSGEYSRSRTEASVHWIGLTTSFGF